MFCVFLFDDRGELLHMLDLDDDLALAIFEHAFVIVRASGARVAVGRVGRA